MILGKLANLIDFGFLHVCVQSTSNFVFKLLERVEKMKKVQFEKNQFCQKVPGNDQ